MEEYMYIAAIVGCVFGILQIILFIKLWIMTNDIRKIKNKLIIRLCTCYIRNY